MSKNHTIASISVSASASNNNINLYKFFVSGGHQFADFAEGLNFIRENNWTLNVAGHQGIRIGLNKQSYGWELRLFNLDPSDYGKTLHDRTYDMGQRMTAKKMEQIAEYVYDFICEVVDYEQEQDEQEQERIADAMQELVAEAQETFDNYVMDLQSIADNYGALKTALDYYAAKQIAERIKNLGESLLSDLGAISGCEMCEEDGYWFDTAEFERWAGGYTFDHIDEIENLIDTLDYYITDAPLGLEQEDSDWVRDTEDTWRYDYPHYLWEDMKYFALTWMNYGPCTMPF